MKFPQGTTTDLTKISPFAMYTFDATWMLIRSLHKLSQEDSIPQMTKTSRCFDNVIKNASKYLAYLKDTNFFGISGAVQYDKNISNNRKEGVLYGLYNAQRVVSSTLSFSFKLKFVVPLVWCQINNKWNNYTDSMKYSIIWPDKKFNHVPTDYPQLSGRSCRLSENQQGFLRKIRNKY